ncbi:MAG TPA: hypothetical protein VFL75_00590 [Candidatus Limnocylindria bacterium]|nr:hypothetical protein [Candidatus Limnocylindria bacterium]
MTISTTTAASSAVTMPTTNVAPVAMLNAEGQAACAPQRATAARAQNVEV